jgi:hypothetical protein
MALPKINTITFEITIPSTKKKMRFRPFLVKEEKILMLAQKGTPDDIFFAVKQLLTNCSIDPIDVDTLTTFDLDYIFIKLRAQSVGNIIELKFQDNEDGKTREFKVDLNEVEVTESPEHSKKIKINEQFGLLMKYPDVAMMNSINRPNCSLILIFLECSGLSVTSTSLRSTLNSLVLPSSLSWNLSSMMFPTDCALSLMKM